MLAFNSVPATMPSTATACCRAIIPAGLPVVSLVIVCAVLRSTGETLLRKLGRADMIKKQSVPEIVFAYFHNK